MPGPVSCEHCAEIPLLREEVDALRARLNALTTLPLSAIEPLPRRETFIDRLWGGPGQAAGDPIASGDQG